MADRFHAWLSREAPRRQAYLVAALIGLLVNLLAFGPGHLLGTSAYWDMPQEDTRTYLMGYRYFLHEPWQWPPFSVHTMNVPFTKNIVFNDSIPLWAAINKVLSTIVPPWGTFSERAYIGVWHGIDYMMQAAFAVCVLRSLGKRTFLHVVVTAIFFLCVPAFIFRYGHASLSAQYLVLAGLALYLRAPSGQAPRVAWFATFCALLCAAAMINPYHVAMDFAFLLVALLRTKNLRAIVVGGVLGLASVGIGAATAGFFVSEAKVAMTGFDLASANLLAPFVPQRSILLGDLFGLGKIDPTQYQYEGYAYLGLGVLGLLVAFLILGRRTLPGTIRRHPFLLVAVVGAALFSLSNHVWFAGHQVLAFDVPKKLHWMTEQYRAPARFVWIPMYTVVAFLLNWAFEAFRGKQWVLAMVVGAQVVDGGLGDWARLHEQTASTFRHYLPMAPWQRLVHAHETVEVDPPYDCILDGTYNVDQISLEIEFYASQKALPINGVYSARPTRNCEVERQGRMNLEPVANRLYVVLKKAKAVLPRFEAKNLKCAEFEYGWVCSTKTSAIDTALADGIVTPMKPAPKLAIGQKLSLIDKSDPPLEDLSWSWADETGRWSMGARSGVPVSVDTDGVRPLTLRVQASAPLCGPRTSSDVDVLLNGVRLDTMHFTHETNPQTVARSIPIPDPKVLARPAMLDFAPHDLRSPQEVGCNEDPRKLGVLVTNLWFE